MNSEEILQIIKVFQKYSDIIPIDDEPLSLNNK